MDGSDNDAPDVGTMGGNMGDEDVTDPSNDQSNDPGPAPDVGTMGGNMGDEDVTDPSNDQSNDPGPAPDVGTMGGGLNVSDDPNDPTSVDDGVDSEMGMVSEDPTEVDVPVDGGFFATPFGKVAKGIAMAAIAATNPALATAIGIVSGIANNNPGQVAGGIASGLGLGALGSGLVSIGVNAATGNNVSGQIGSTAGATLGDIFGQATGIPGMNVVGSTIGAGIGNAAATGGGFGNGPGISGADNANIGGESNMNGLGILGGLGSLYQNTQDANSLSQSAQTGGNASLSDLYGPDSPYARQLRQQLERRDAASGRRSQYGAREVELQAKLADQYGRHAPALQNSNLQRDQFAAQQRQLQQQAKTRRLNTLYGLAREFGGKDFLNSMFSGGSSGGYIDPRSSSGDYFGNSYDGGGFEGLGTSNYQDYSGDSSDYYAQNGSDVGFDVGGGGGGQDYSNAEPIDFLF
jgi:hypothetical protein